MDVSRREFLSVAAGTTAAEAIGPVERVVQKAPPDSRNIRVLAFDGFVILDQRAVAKRAEEVLAGKSTEFANLWKTRQFEYTWLLTAGQQYEDSRRVTEAALNYTSISMKLSLSPAQREWRMDVYRELPPWPDAPKALADLRRDGIKDGIPIQLDRRVPAAFP